MGDAEQYVGDQHFCGAGMAFGNTISKLRLCALRYVLLMGQSLSRNETH